MEPDVYVILFEILILNDKYVVYYDICYISFLLLLTT